MPRIVICTPVRATPERCFDAARDIGLHLRSMAHTGEEAIAGRTAGLIGPGEEVTWRGRHLGWTHTHTARITAFDRPRQFRDEMVEGRFARFVHDHDFEATDHGTVMRDVVEYEVPWGWIGKALDRIVLRRYLARLLRERSEEVKHAAERLSRPFEVSTASNSSRTSAVAVLLGACLLGTVACASFPTGLEICTARIEVLGPAYEGPGDVAFRIDAGGPSRIWLPDGLYLNAISAVRTSADLKVGFIRLPRPVPFDRDFRTPPSPAWDCLIESPIPLRTCEDPFCIPAGEYRLALTYNSAKRAMTNACVAISEPFSIERDSLLLHTGWSPLLGSYLPMAKRSKRSTDAPAEKCEPLPPGVDGL